MAINPGHTGMTTAIHLIVGVGVVLASNGAKPTNPEPQKGGL